MDASELRGLLLGPQFAPRFEDIPTPPILLDKGVPQDILRLVSLSTNKRLELETAAGNDDALRLAHMIASCLRMRDGGGADGNGTYVIGKLDDAGASVPDLIAARVLPEQDFDLQSALGSIVKTFLGLGDIAQQVADEKKDSPPTPSSIGGSELPMSADTLTSESHSDTSMTATSPDGSPSTS